MDRISDEWLAGADGCPAGWVVAFVRPQGPDIRIRTASHFADIFDAPEMPAIVAVDMPIGLPKHSPPKGRLAEREVRPLLGDRKSSVFRIPSRAAVYAGAGNVPADERERFFHSCEIARKTSEDSKAFAKQGFYLFPKIVEIDQFLRADTSYADRVFEIHPEVAFWRLNGERELDLPKKLKGRCHDPGLALRRRLLVDAGFPSAVVNSEPPKGAGPDDLLDALAGAAIARRLRQGVARSFPDPPERDEFGLTMAIWA